jgi:hypothetical protein
MPPDIWVASRGTDHGNTLHDKEHTMHRSWVPIALITLLLGLGLASQTAVANNRTPSRPAKPRVVATVMALDPRGLATLQTVDGARYEVVTGTGWRVGDTVECEQNERTRVKWEALDCRKS